jgi:hypothetical protein
VRTSPSSPRRSMPEAMRSRPSSPAPSMPASSVRILRLPGSPNQMERP